MYRFSRYRAQYICNLRLAFPIILSQMGAIVVQVADTMMVGRYGGEDAMPLAAASFASTFFFLPFITIMGLTFGLTPVVGELYGQGRAKESSVYLHSGLVMYGVIAIIATALLFAMIPIMHHLSQPEQVVEMAIPYYVMLVWSMFPFVIFTIFKQFLEGMGNTVVAMVCVVVSNIVNVLLNYIFIWGEWGAPEMGAQGAGLSTLISRVLMMVLMLVHVYYSRRYGYYLKSFTWRNVTRAAQKRLLLLGAPISSQLFMEVSSFVAIGLMFGWFAAEQIGAYQIGITIGNASFMIVLAIASVATIRVSHSFGEGNISQMRRASSAAWHLAVVWSIMVAVVFLLFGSEIVGLMTTNEEVIELASFLLLMVAAYQLPDALQCIGVGVMRGMQDVRVIPLYSFISYWVCNIPVSYVCAFHLGMGPGGLYMGFISGLSVASILTYRRIKLQQKRLLLN